MRASRWRPLKRLWISAMLKSWIVANLWDRLHGLRLEGWPSDEVWYFAFAANMHGNAFR